MPKNKAINLLPQEEFNVSAIGRTLKWAMGTFRIIVIATEMIVMAAFLSRFWLDARNSDLNESIKVKTAQITAQADLEKEFRNLQSKLKIFKLVKAGAQPSTMVDLITSKLPSDVTLIGISVSEGTGQIKGTSISELGIAQFVANLHADSTFKTVDLGQTNSSESNQLQTSFLINITY